MLAEQLARRSRQSHQLKPKEAGEICRFHPSVHYIIDHSGIGGLTSRPVRQILLDSLVRRRALFSRPASAMEASLFIVVNRSNIFGMPAPGFLLLL
jgi:hypothetical protein